jgi:tRNA pseudouridine13 synthase
MTAHWPRVWPTAACRALFKSHLDDFRVVELPAEVPLGSGEHLYLRVEKSGEATPAVAAMLARTYAVPASAVGYAGMKDKHAVTEQWFSVHTPRDADTPSPDSNVRVLEATRHRRKLRRGDLAGNRFRVRLRGVDGKDWAERLSLIRERGVPNYFGPQRFGGDNLERARDWLGCRRRRRVSAFRAGLYLSVVRAFLFNEVLAARVEDGSWERMLPGDVAADVPPGAAPAPTGPLWGRGRSAAADRALAIERAALAAHAELCGALEHAGPVQQRRNLVLRAGDFEWCTDGDQLQLGFSLPPGGYATTLLAEAFELVAVDCGP